MRLAAAALSLALLFAGRSARAIEFEEEAPSPPPEVRWSEPALGVTASTRAAIDADLSVDDPIAASLTRIRATLRLQRGALHVVANLHLRGLVALQRPSGAMSQLEWLPAESFIQGRFGAVTLDAGLLDPRWGESTRTSPVDLLTPRDLRDGLATPEPVRLALPALRARGRSGAFDWDIVASPAHLPWKLPLLGDFGLSQVAPRSLMPAARLLTPTQQARFGGLSDEPLRFGMASAQGGLRAGLVTRTLSAHLSYAELVDPTPRLTPSPAYERLLSAADATAREEARSAVRRDLAMGRGPLGADYERMRMAGLDAAYWAGPLKLTVEAAWFPARLFWTPDLRALRRPSVTTALGVELLAPFATFTAGLQTTAVFSPAAGERLLFIDAGSAVDSGPRTAAVMNLLSLAASQRLLDDRLEWSLLVMTSLRTDVATVPTLTWRVDDRHRLSIGAFLIAGRRDSLGAAYARSSEAFVEYLLQL